MKAVQAAQRMTRFTNSSTAMATEARLSTPLNITLCGHHKTVKGRAHEAKGDKLVAYDQLAHWKSLLSVEDQYRVWEWSELTRWTSTPRTSIPTAFVGLGSSGFYKSERGANKLARSRFIVARGGVIKALLLFSRGVIDSNVPVLFHVLAGMALAA